MGTSGNWRLGKPIPSPVVLGQVTEKFREAVKTKAEHDEIPIYPFDHKERKDDVANQMTVPRGSEVNAPIQPLNGDRL
jgi:hypothetical protein